MTRRLSLLIGLTLLVAACGGGGSGISMPAPTATPAPGGFGTVTGSAVAEATALAQARGPVGPVEPVRRAGARPAYVPNQLMVKFRAGTPTASASSLHDQVGGSLIRVNDRLDVHVVRLAPGVSATTAMAAYRASALVEYVEQDAYAYASATPTDPLYSSQAWHYNQVNLPAAWDVTTGSAAIIVAVLDTGIRDDHPDLTGMTAGTNSHNFFNGANDANFRDPGCPTVAPTEFSHGTHVAGTVAAVTNNGIGVAGVNWGGVAGTKIMALRVLGEDIPSSQCGVGVFSDIAAAVTYAADHGAKVINMSLGGSVGSPTMDSAIDYARNTRGVVIFAAAGNNSCGPVEYPARNANVIPVAATGNTSPITRASYSACGAELTTRGIAAPGGDGPVSTGFFVWSTSWRPSQPTSFQYVGFQGTSMATPHAAGTSALMLSRGIASPATIQSVLRSTAVCPSGLTCPNTQLGAGVINAAAAVGAAPTASRLCAFAGTLSGSTITRESEMRLVPSGGAFTITNAQSGIRSVFLWQDFDNSATVTPGDAYGQSTGTVAIFSGMTTSGVNVIVRTRTAGSTVYTVPGGTASCF